MLYTKYPAGCQFFIFKPPADVPISTALAKAFHWGEPVAAVMRVPSPRADSKYMYVCIPNKQYARTSNIYYQGYIKSKDPSRFTFYLEQGEAEVWSNEDLIRKIYGDDYGTTWIHDYCLLPANNKDAKGLLTTIMD